MLNSFFIYLKDLKHVEDNFAHKHWGEKMATYKEIQEEFRYRFGRTANTCWIAHVKEIHGLTRGSAHNRRGKERDHPCPERIRPMIEETLKHFKMI